MDTHNKLFVTYGGDALAMGTALLERSGAQALFRAAHSVGIKPNLVVARPASEGATTHAEFAEAAIRFAKDCGVREITIMEGAWIGADTREAFRVCGYEALAKRYGVRLVDLKRDAQTTVRVDGHDVPVCKSALEAGLLVNLPVLKAHCQTRMTCALKNLKGCIADKEKRRYHAQGLHAPIARLAAALRPALTLVDGLCGDLTFEEGGTPVAMNRAILGFDPVLTDAYAASLLGLCADDIPYIGMAAALGAGNADVAADTVIELCRPDERPIMQDARAGGALVGRLARHIVADNACSACYGSALHALRALSDGGTLPREPVHIGQGFKGKRAPGVGIGNCCAGFDSCVKGCPPAARDIYECIQAHNAQ